MTTSILIVEGVFNALMWEYFGDMKEDVIREMVGSEAKCGKNMKKKVVNFILKYRGKDDLKLKEQDVYIYTFVFKLMTMISCDIDFDERLEKFEEDVKKGGMTEGEYIIACDNIKWVKEMYDKIGEGCWCNIGGSVAGKGEVKALYIVDLGCRFNYDSYCIM